MDLRRDLHREYDSFSRDKLDPNAEELQEFILANLIEEFFLGFHKTILQG